MLDSRAVIASLVGLHQKHDEPDAKQRTAAFWWGVQDEDVAWWLASCKTVNSAIAQSLYIAHATEDCRHARGLKDWAYRVAVEYAGSRGSGQRRRSVVEAYRTDWGHQSARDGLAAALWPHLKDDIPGIGKRCDAFGVGKQAFQRVRDEVMRQAGDLITGFDMDMEQCRTGRYSRDFKDRWEVAHGVSWPHNWDG